MMEHVDYPHDPGRLYNCPACEAECLCDPCASCRQRLSDCCTQCVFCALLAEQVSVCSHAWQAGMMVVADEDLDEVSKARPVVCANCDTVYGGW